MLARALAIAVLCCAASCSKNPTEGIEGNARIGPGRTASAGGGVAREVDRARVAIGPDADRTDVSSIVGKTAPSWDLKTWFNGPPRRLEDLRGRVVLVRWFMSSECPYCQATAPSLVSLHDTYADAGLTIVGMYHHKGDGPLVVADVQALVDDHFHFRFPVAIDDDWKTLKRWWLDAHPESWTSVSFLVDRSGKARFVHLGGEYAPGSADFAQMKTWIEALLSEPASAPTH